MDKTFRKSFNEQWMSSSSNKSETSERTPEKTPENPLGCVGNFWTKKEIPTLQTIEGEETKRIKTKKEEEYEQNVKTYTSFLIGRKISQNTEPFTDDQINSK